MSVFIHIESSAGGNSSFVHSHTQEDDRTHNMADTDSHPENGG